LLGPWISVPWCKYSCILLKHEDVYQNLASVWNLASGKALMQLHEETSIEKHTEKSSDSEPRRYSYLDLDSVPWRVVHRKLACVRACLWCLRTSSSSQVHFAQPYILNLEVC
jgi:hypothetical protein